MTPQDFTLCMESDRIFRAIVVEIGVGYTIIQTFNSSGRIKQPSALQGKATAWTTELMGNGL